nr:organic cation/carnitine transporter 7 [Tanacetum cinerariifolium]
MELTLLTYIRLAVEADLQLTSSEENLISIVTYVGIILGTWIWSAVSDSFGRNEVVAIYTFSAQGVNCGGDEKKELLVESKVLIPETTFVGVESMVLIPETTFVDVESRVLIPEMTFVGVESRGIVERYGWRLFLGVSSLPSLVALLFYTLVPESPRFLYAKGELGEASKILNWGAELNKRQLPEGFPSEKKVILVQKKAEGKGNSEKGAQNEREVVTSEEDEIKDVTLDIDKTLAGEIQIDEARHTLKKDDPVDRTGPKVEQGNLENERGRDKRKDKANNKAQ